MSSNLLEIIGTEWRRFARWCAYAIVIFVPSPSYAQSGGSDATNIIIFLLVVALYFLPAIIAHNRNHRNRNAITALNIIFPGLTLAGLVIAPLMLSISFLNIIFLSWMAVGWVIALVWSFTSDTEEKPLSAPVGGLATLPPADRKRREALRQIEKDRREGVFRPDGMVRDMPYRVLPNGEIDALIQGGMVRFRNLDDLDSMTKAAPVPPADPKPKFDSEKERFPFFFPISAKVEHHFGRRVGILPDGSVLGETDLDSEPRKFGSFEEWRRFIGE